MEISVEIPLDASGFIRRECPNCERQFKWFHGQTADAPDDFIDPEIYFCPYCGVSSDTDNWATAAQVEYAESVAMGPAIRLAEDEIRDMLRSSSMKGVKFSGLDAPRPLDPPHDPDDMLMVAPPCHPFEPLKITEEWAENLHCLICGELFRV